MPHAKLFNDLLPTRPLFTRVQMSQTEATPALPEYSSTPPPSYNVTATTTERVIVPAAYRDRSSPPHFLAGSTINHTVHSNSHILAILPQSGHTTSNRRRQKLPPLPAYGRQAIVSGSISLAPGKWISTITKVAVSLKGQVSSVLIQQCMREPASSKKLFFISQSLWKKTPENTQNSLDSLIQFKVQIPGSIPGEQEGHSDLPPTFDEETQMVFGIATHVKIEYTLRIDIWRRGLRSHKSLTIPILYLPKTYPAPHHIPLEPHLSVMDAKRFGLESEKWRQVNLRIPQSYFSDETWSVSMALPKGTTNPSCQPIPIVITVSRPAPPTISTYPLSTPSRESKESVAFSKGHTVLLGPGLSELKENFDLKVTLVKHIKLHCSWPHSGYDWVNERVLGEAVVRKMTTDIERRKNGLSPRVVTTIHSCLNGGIEQGETTWGMVGFISVEYAIRIAINIRIGTSANCRVEHEEPLLVTTHGPCDLLDGGVQGPALRMLEQ